MRFAAAAIALLISVGANGLVLAGDVAPDPYPLEGTEMTLADLVVDARRLTGKRVSITDGCDLSQATNSYVVCSKGGSFLYLSSPTAEREYLRYALKNCSGWEPNKKCRASAVIGTVKGQFLQSVPVLDAAKFYLEGNE